jgi:hypothetical protein
MAEVEAVELPVRASAELIVAAVRENVVTVRSAVSHLGCSHPDACLPDRW